MSETKKYDVIASDGRTEVRSCLHATDLREALEKSFKLIPRDWPGRPAVYTSVTICEATVNAA